jgi:hypothetical protein
MNDLAVSLGSLIVGVVATIVVSRYYFKRTVDKSLTAYVQFVSSLFEGLDSSVRDAIKVAYKGTPVTDLLEIQLLIANTGERPIRDVIHPLSLAIPPNCSLMDASVLHVSPNGRDVKIAQSGAALAFVFPLLNAGDFFIAKLLLQGKAGRKDLRFTITADDLPPTLEAALLPSDLLQSEKGREFEWPPLWIGLLLVSIGAALAGLIYAQWPLIIECWRAGLWLSLGQHWPILASAAVAAIPALILLVTGPMLIIGAFTDFSFPKRRRFRVPDSFHGRHIHFRELAHLSAAPSNEKSGEDGGSR